MKIKQLLEHPKAERIIERISFWGAVIGSIFLALNLPISGWGYVPFMLSNAATLCLLRKSNASKALTHQSYFFVVINSVGIIRWLL
jgi:hypothetical protein